MQKYIIAKSTESVNRSYEGIPIACFDSYDEAVEYRKINGWNNLTAFIYSCPYIRRPSIWQKLKNYFGQRK